LLWNKTTAEKEKRIEKEGEHITLITSIIIVITIIAIIAIIIIIS